MARSKETKTPHLFDGHEATTLVRSLALNFSLKWKIPYSHAGGYLKARVSVAIV